MTLTGPGGSGKTRLAVAVAARLEPHYPDGVYFVGLHTVDRGELMWATIAEALDAGDSGDATPLGRVTGHLAQRRALLVLDNLEQIPDADEVVGALLSAGPRVRVLAASRCPLLLVGEHEFPVLPLAVPDPAGLEAMSSPAVEMFLRHAQMVRPSFRLTDENRADIAALCRRLDGLPLALELAAAHSRLLSPRALLSRIDSRLGAGVTAADRPERQRTLGATIGWSYDLLDEIERSVFRRLGVFRSSCDLNALAVVAGQEGVETLDVASRLVATNLVRVDEAADGEPRIALLETIRAFALERLEESGEGEQVRLRHVRWCIDVLERATALLRGPQHLGALDTISPLDSDIRAALDWSLRPAGPDGRERVAAGHTLLALVSGYSYRFGSVAEVEARMWQERAVAIAGDEDSEATVTLLHDLGISVLQEMELDTAGELFDRSLQMAIRLGLRHYEARAYNDLGITRRYGGDYAEALRLFELSLDISRETGNVVHQATSLTNLVVVHIDLGRYADAARLAQQAMAANAANGDLWGAAIDRLNYTAAILKAEGPPAAHARFVEWADDIASFRDLDLSINLMELGAAIAAGVGEVTLAARLLAGADSQRTAIQMPRSGADESVVDDWLDAARRSIPPGDWDQAYESGLDVSPEQAIELVRSIEVDRVRHSAGTVASER